jgi:hypothetical protein
VTRTTESLPKGKTLSDYDPKPSMVGKASKAPEDLRIVMEQVYNGNTVIKVPIGRSQKLFTLRIREYLARRGQAAKICKIGEDELYVRLIGV